MYIPASNRAYVYIRRWKTLNANAILLCSIQKNLILNLISQRLHQGVIIAHHMLMRRPSSSGQASWEHGGP